MSVCIRPKHVYTLVLDTPNFEIRISPSTNYGYFERNTDGAGGGLWFLNYPPYKVELIDYDGVSCLPREVAQALRDQDYYLDSNFDWGITNGT